MPGHRVLSKNLNLLILSLSSFPYNEKGRDGISVKKIYQVSITVGTLQNGTPGRHQKMEPEWIFTRGVG